MPCYYPIPAWRTEDRVKLFKEMPDSTPLALPCGTCVGCRATRAQHWALRCHLESLEHERTSIATLTYDNANLPTTLEKGHFQLWIKRLRKANKDRFRYFACGEYGERYGRPHYHAILFGLPHDSDSIDRSWQLGLTHTDNVSTEAINYVTNYTTKKLGWPKPTRDERLDPETGELYIWQPPFQLMSRRPGLGSKAKRHYHSWAKYAISNGTKISIPRFYKETWNLQATPNEKEDNDYQKYLHALTRTQLTAQELDIKERTHHARNQLYSALRRYD